MREVKQFNSINMEKIIVVIPLRGETFLTRSKIINYDTLYYNLVIFFI